MRLEMVRGTPADRRRRPDRTVPNAAAGAWQARPRDASSCEHEMHEMSKESLGQDLPPALLTYAGDAGDRGVGFPPDPSTAPPAEGLAQPAPALRVEPPPGSPHDHDQATPPRRAAHRGRPSVPPRRGRPPARGLPPPAAPGPPPAPTS